MKKNMAYRKAVRGKNLMIFIDDKAIALSTACGLDLTADTEETSSKDSGSWKDFDVTMLSFTGSTDVLVSAIASDSDTADLAHKELFAKFIAMEPTDLIFGEIVGRTNANNEPPETTGWLPPSDNGYVGKALITGLSFSAPVDGKATMTISFQGTGALTAQTV